MASRAKPESKETPKDETVHSVSFLRKALKEKQSGTKSKKKADSNQWKEDGDDAHFVAQKSSRKKISASSKGHPAVKVTSKKKVSAKKKTITK